MINVIHYPDTNSVEVTWLDDEGKQTRCHSYADVQMDMLEADMGADAANYAELIATVKANIVPPVQTPAPTYQELRVPAYPPITDYLDGIVKGDAEQVAKYIADCLAVKAQFPKP